MKTKLLIAGALVFSIGLSAQTCYQTPDGVDGNNWSYKDYVIPTGNRLDSVYMNATRAGFPSSSDDFALSYCAGDTSYNGSVAVQPWNYQTDTTDEYNHWINLTSYNYTSTGMVRVVLPTNAGAAWDEVCFAVSPISTCFQTPDGVDGNNWSYKDFVIPAGDRLDSVYMDATRAGYPSSSDDFDLSYCAGTTTYNGSVATQAWNYQTDTTDEYGHWINLTSYNYTATGMVRVVLPTNAGASWNDLCFAVSSITTGINHLTSTANYLMYPNPASRFVTIRCNQFQNNPLSIELINLMGQQIKKEKKSFSGANNELKFSLNGVATGMYFLKVGDQVQKLQVVK